MSAYAEQEELDKLKAWWKTYGASVIVGVLLGAAALAGFRYWTYHTEQRLHLAAGLYDRMFSEFHANRAKEARATGDRLIKDYASTPYASMAGLLLARLDFEAGDSAKAREHLRWVLDHADADAVRHSARLRLARIHLDAGDVPAAQALLDVKNPAGFEAEYDEMKGDAYVALGQREAARTAYREALKHLPAGSPYVTVLTMKLDDLGPERGS